MRTKKKERKILEEEEEKRKEIEQQKKIEKMNLEWEKQLQKEKEWETNPPSENDPEREKYEIWKQKHDYNQKIKLINNQLDQDIDKYFELKNSNKEISKEIKDRIVENLGRFNELTNDFYYHERLDELRNDKDLTDLIDEYEEMRYEQEREEEEDDDDSYWNDD